MVIILVGLIVAALVSEIGMYLFLSTQEHDDVSW